MQNFLTNERLAFFESSVRAKALEVQERITSRTAQLTDTPQELSDEADRAFVEESRRSAFNLVEYDRVLLKKLKAALTRIATGDFGYCEQCGDDIDEARLIIRPEARCCVDCQSIQDAKSQHVLNRAA